MARELSCSSAHGIFLEQESNVSPTFSGEFFTTQPPITLSLIFKAEILNTFTSGLFQFSSVAQSCLTLQPHEPQVCQASLSITNSRSSPKPMSIESVMPPNHLILCFPLLLLPSVFPRIRVFSNESALRIKWPKY